MELVLFRRRWMELAACVVCIMATLLVYGVMQERIIRVPYGSSGEFFQYSLFLVFCNRILTCAFAITVMLVLKKDLSPVAPIYKYGGVSLSNILATTCQYEALKYVSFPVQTLGKSAKMIPVMIWGTLIMQKRYGLRDYLLALCITAGAAVFLLYGDGAQTKSLSGGENSIWGLALMAGYLGFDGFTSTFQDKLFKGYSMEVFNQILYVTLCSCALSTFGLLTQGNLFPALSFISRHRDCFFHVFLLSLAATASQFFINHTIKTFGALTFAIIMTTRQLVSILLSCLWFAHPLSWKQWLGTLLVFGSLYYKSYAGATDRTKQAVKEPESVELQGKTDTAQQV
ncbi:UDP-galactose/UDP-glucose transporter 5B [Selaginella moellendorffii]|nr:UDP-galactose/UDP-glucose transporter 5B [Selaginella moellendorffii]|eukprot:XP_002974853.2 UDP-galactose/UDP-glucose transporter 5B [Selaginella moellendorffii]